MSSNDLLISPRLAEIGKIKLGTKNYSNPRRTKAGRVWYPPLKLDHWLVTTMERDERGALLPDQVVMKRIGKTRSLWIILPYDDIQLNFHTYRAARKGSKFACRSLCNVTEQGEAERFFRRDPDGHGVLELEEPQNVPCPCPALRSGHCKPFGVLRVLLPVAPVVGGFYVFRTGSWNTVRNILSSLQLMSNLTHGNLAGLKLLLTCQAQTVETREGKRRTIWTANLSYPGDTQSFLDDAAVTFRQRFSTSKELKQLAEPEDPFVAEAEEQARLEIGAPDGPDQVLEDAEEFQPEFQDGGEHDPQVDEPCPEESLLVDDPSMEPPQEDDVDFSEVPF